MRPETVLAFDTSAAHCAAALLLPDGNCLIMQEEMAKGQAERLLPLVQDLLAKAGLGWPDLAAIGVGTGPGNFTGVRISVATARGLSLALGIPAIGVTVFDALAQGLPRPLAVAQDARRDEVYLQLFNATDHPAQLLTVDQARQAIGALPTVGSATEMLNKINPLHPAMPLVQAIAQVAQARLGTTHPRPAPFYLRSADAAPPSDLPPVILDA
ncbi:tRNA (adenosine(37)-N6)-threonylcarbamoyltransferase complex dimerization subunit type 1 TsaB [Pseudotabrizicola sp. L79]|uniref:tRNA (adenosine(37)-N6)-threonylcarbamoyltransferase complex dimerization subunit type 1 TsaB n=1 Tax=Pseudotabrizicola sp. L79 TaxID=3118402 RepID=UPI002F940E2D